MERPLLLLRPVILTPHCKNSGSTAPMRASAPSNYTQPMASTWKWYATRAGATPTYSTTRPLQRRRPLLCPQASLSCLSVGSLNVPTPGTNAGGAWSCITIGVWTSAARGCGWRRPAGSRRASHVLFDFFNTLSARLWPSRGIASRLVQAAEDVARDFDHVAFVPGRC